MSQASATVSGVSRRLRPLAAPFVVAPPAGVRVRTRVPASPEDEAVLVAVGVHLGTLAAADLAARCRQGRLGAADRAVSRQVRKRALTTACSSRWAGAITRTSEDAWALAERNLHAEAASLRARIGRIGRRLQVPAGERRGRVRGYASQAERWEKQRRLQVLRARLDKVEVRLDEGRVSVCRGGRRLARSRHNLAQAGLDERHWRSRWKASRLFLTADGEAAKNFGNETIRWHPEAGWVEIKLPASLARLANRPHGRYHIEDVRFAYRGAEVAAQARTGAVRYDIFFDPVRARWYLDASWTFAAASPPALDTLRRHPVLAVDVNAGHLAAIVLDASGNPVGDTATIGLQMEGLPTTVRDGHLRNAVASLIDLAKANCCRAIVAENLDLARAREQGREYEGRGPSRGSGGRAFRRLIANIPTSRFRHWLVQMTSNAGLAVIAVDPAYTSRWGAEHWFGALQQIRPGTSSHHAAALVIGRRGLGQRARRRERCDSTRPEDRDERATNSAVRPTPAPTGLPGQRHRKPGNRKAQGQLQPRQKTQPAERASPGNQAAQDRWGPPAGQGSHLPSV